MQRYIVLYVLEHKIEEKFLKLTTINLKMSYRVRIKGGLSVLVLDEIGSKHHFIYFCRLVIREVSAER